MPAVGGNIVILVEIQPELLGDAFEPLLYARIGLLYAKIGLFASCRPFGHRTHVLVRGYEPFHLLLCELQLPHRCLSRDHAGAMYDCNGCKAGDEETKCLHETSPRRAVSGSCRTW
jgi:hypothetical protein